MATIKKVELLTLLNQFEQLNEKEEANQIVAADILAQCQMQAMEMGNYIETNYPNTEDIISLLEEYCECLYQLSLKDNRNKQKKIKKKIRKLLINLQNDVRCKLPADKKVMVFLPYKASMWDSLESIYLAAKEDEDTETYVIPIPYYEKNNDGTFGRLCYEADQYPEHIPITSYQTYRLAEEKPDVIFIHNAYDNWNYVTSVHPDFYAQNLRQHTKMLIYVPYFVLEEIKLEDQAVIDRMKHFCFAPGIVFADKVIVQSENMRKIYMNEFCKAAKENGLTGNYTDKKFLKEKFLGLGSPKLDNVTAIGREEVRLPETWLPYLRKSDGSNKKIILYNNSIFSFLKYREKMIKKIEEVFRIFKECSGEIVLWWRPHPLMSSTIKAMCPDLWMPYLNLVERYKEEAWGIYDDSSDLHRSLVLSDGYYGDPSSVVTLYRTLGKPIMLQNLEPMQNHSLVNELYLGNMTYANEYLWFYLRDTNALFKMKPGDFVPLFVGSFPSEEFAVINLYSDIVAHDGKIYVSPAKASTIGVYDMEQDLFKSIPLPQELQTEENVYKLTHISVIGSCLFFAPGHLQTALVYDILLGSMKTFSFKTDELKRSMEIHTVDSFPFRCSYVLGDKVFLPYCQDNKILVFDMKSESYDLKTVGEPGVAFSWIAYDGRFFWLPAFTADGSVIRWDYDNNSYTSYAFPFSLENQWHMGIAYAILADTDLYLFPAMEGCVWVFNTINNTYQIEDTLTSNCCKSIKENANRAMPNYSIPVQIENKICIFCLKTRKFCEYDIKQKLIQMHTVKINSNDLYCQKLKVQEMQSLVRKRAKITEGKIALNDYIAIVGNHDIKKEYAVINDELKGNKIFRYCKDIIMQE